MSKEIFLEETFDNIQEINNTMPNSDYAFQEIRCVFSNPDDKEQNLLLSGGTLNTFKILPKFNDLENDDNNSYKKAVQKSIQEKKEVAEVIEEVYAPFIKQIISFFKAQENEKEKDFLFLQEVDFLYEEGVCYSIARAFFKEKLKEAGLSCCLSGIPNDFTEDKNKPLVIIYNSKTLELVNEEKVKSNKDEDNKDTFEEEVKSDTDEDNKDTFYSYELTFKHKTTEKKFALTNIYLDGNTDPRQIENYLDSQTQKNIPTIVGGHTNRSITDYTDSEGLIFALGNPVLASNDVFFVAPASNETVFVETKQCFIKNPKENPKENFENPVKKYQSALGKRPKESAEEFYLRKKQLLTELVAKNSANKEIFTNLVITAHALLSHIENDLYKQQDAKKQEKLFKQYGHYLVKVNAVLAIAQNDRLNKEKKAEKLHNANQQLIDSTIRIFGVEHALTSYADEFQVRNKLKIFLGITLSIIAIAAVAVGFAFLSGLTLGLPVIGTAAVFGIFAVGGLGVAGGMSTFFSGTRKKLSRNLKLKYGQGILNNPDIPKPVFYHQENDDVNFDNLNKGGKWTLKFNGFPEKELEIINQLLKEGLIFDGEFLYPDKDKGFDFYTITLNVANANDKATVMRLYDIIIMSGLNQDAINKDEMEFKTDAQTVHHGSKNTGTIHNPLTLQQLAKDAFQQRRGEDKPANILPDSCESSATIHSHN